MEDNSANEKQPAKETEAMELPWQDISNLKPNNSSCILWKKNIAKGEIPVDFSHDVLAFLNKDEYTHWLPITQPEPSTVEVPVEPERVSVQEFAKNPVGKWVNLTYDCALDFWNEVKSDKYTYHLAITAIGAGHPIYATNPTAWLAWLAEQEGKI
jgi:hypothetical protein